MLYILTGLSVVLSAVSTYFFVQAKKYKEALSLKENIENEAQIATNALESANRMLSEEKAVLKTKLESAAELNNKLEEIASKVSDEKGTLEKQLYNYKTHIELANQRLNENEKKMRAWEEDKARIFKDTKEAMFETGKEVFNKEAENITKKNYEQFEKIVANLAAISGQVKNHGNQMDVLFRALSSPAAIGQFSEIGLANTLKDYGLIEGRDFHMQYSVVNSDEGAKRPDAVIFIRDNVVVLDSKASKFFLQLAETSFNEQSELEVLDKIKKSMNLHLKSLTSKGYKDAISDDLKMNGRNNPCHIQLVMFVQSEAHIEKICKADPDFINNAAKSGVLVSGPTGLNSILSFASYFIEKEQQTLNQEKIVNEIGRLLGSVEIMLSMIARVGSGLKSAASNYERLVGSVNRNFLPKAKSVVSLGVPVAQNKKLPEKLDSFHVVASSDALIEAEAAEDEFLLESA